jgi:probable rRNA maturation factor
MTSEHTYDGPDAIAIEIEISDGQSHLLGLDRPRLAAIARRVLEAEGIARAEVSIALVDDATIREVHRRHLDHDTATDVISFVLSEPGDDRLSGELVISAETAVEMARRDGIEGFTEVTLYVIHGLLHLVGLDDLTTDGAAAMRRREANHLATEGLSHPFSPVDLQVDAPRREGVSWRA